jgi:hypothetical protein
MKPLIICLIVPFFAGDALAGNTARIWGKPVPIATRTHAKRKAAHRATVLLKQKDLEVESTKVKLGRKVYPLGYRWARGPSKSAPEAVPHANVLVTAQVKDAAGNRRTVTLLGQLDMSAGDWAFVSFPKLDGSKRRRPDATEEAFLRHRDAEFGAPLAPRPSRRPSTRRGPELESFSVTGGSPQAHAAVAHEITAGLIRAGASPSRAALTAMFAPPSNGPIVVARTPNGDKITVRDSPAARAGMFTAASLSALGL